MPPTSADPRSKDKLPGRPRTGALRWLRLLLLICWIPVLAYAANTTANLLRLPAGAWNSPPAVAAALLPSPLAGSGTPSWAGIVSALVFLALLAACAWASVDWVRERRARRMVSQAPVAAMPPRTAPLWTPRAPEHTSGAEPPTQRIAGGSPGPAHAEPAAQPGSTAFVPRVFVSHSSADNEFGLELERRLKAELKSPDPVFYDSDGGLVGSDEWLKRLQHEITERNVFVLILSPQAFKSGWVDQELSLALREAVSVGGKVIVPVLHQGDEAWPFLRNFQIVDFTKHPFEQAFADLLKAVRLGHSRKAELQGMRLEHLGPPYDLDLLPVPERFVGRARDLDWALDRLAPREPIADGGLASIAATNGLAGIGKSALAGQVVRILYATNRFPNGIAVVLCNGLTDPIAVLKAALSRFDPQRREPQESELQQLRDLAKQVFGRRRALVVLDNVEPDWPVEDVIVPLRVAGAAVLLTSRVRLPASAVPTEASRMLELLSPEEAVDVFAEYVGRGARQGLTLAEHEAVGRIVRALGYHTLAVKLAAARAHRRDLSEVASDFEADPRLGVHLKDGREAVEVVLASSVALLNEHARRLFSVLGAFATTDVGRRAALAVADGLDDPDSRASLDALMDLRLVDTYVAEQAPPEADRERLRLHPLVYIYARQRLAHDDDVDADEAHAAVAAWYAGRASAKRTVELVQDETNIIGALEWLHEHSADDPEAQALIAAICKRMRKFWRDTGRTRAGLHYLPWGIAAAERVVGRTGERTDRQVMIGLSLYYADILQNTGHFQEAETIYQQCLPAAQEIGDSQAEGVVLSNLGRAAQLRGRLEEAEGYLQRALIMHQAVQDRREQAVDLSNLGHLAERRGRLDEAERYFQESLALCREIQDRQGEGAGLSRLGEIAQWRGRLEEAERYFQESLALFREVQDRREQAVDLSNLGHLAERRRRLEEAERYFQESLALFREVQDRQGEGVGLSDLGHLARWHGQLEEAQRYYQQSLAILREVQDQRGEGALLSDLGQVAQWRGQLEQAELYYQESLALCREIQDRQGEGITLTRVGQLMQDQNRLTEAEHYYMAALSIAREVQNLQEQGVIISLLADIAQAAGRWVEAEKHFRESLAIMRYVQDYADEAGICLTLGTLLIEHRDNREEGCTLIMRAVGIRNELGHPGLEAAVAEAIRLGCMNVEDIGQFGLELSEGDGPAGSEDADER